MSATAFEGQAAPNHIKVQPGAHKGSNVTSTSGSGFVPSRSKTRRQHHHHRRHDRTTAATSLAKSEGGDNDEDQESLDLRGLTDTRELWTSTSYPYSAIGKVIWSNGVFCSGSLVGPRHVATARHCAPSGDADAGVSVRFAPLYNQGDSSAAGDAGVTNVYTLSGSTTDGNCGMEHDWAVFILDSDLGNAQGWLGTASPLDSSAGMYDNPAFYTEGYPSDKENGEQPYRETGVTVQSANSKWCDAYGPLITDAFAAGGQSGSPLWWDFGDGTMTSYGSMSSTTGTWTSFATGLDWVGTVNQARQDFP